MEEVVKTKKNQIPVAKQNKVKKAPLYIDW